MFVRNEENLKLTHRTLGVMECPPSHLWLLFWEPSQHVSFTYSETPLKTKDYAARHAVSTFNRQICLFWTPMFDHTLSLLSSSDT